MQNFNEALNKSGLETLTQFNKATEVALQSAEELMKLNIDFTKKLISHSHDCANSWFQTVSTNPQDASHKAAEFVNANNEHVREHLQSLYNWAEALQQKSQVIAESQLTSTQDNIKKQISTLRESAPEQLHTLFDQVQSSLEATQSTVSSLQQTAKEVQRNVAQTVKQSQQAASQAATSAAKATASAVSAASAKK